MRSLREFYLQHQQRASPLVLATVVSTLGSTYRKSGAQMLIDAVGDSAGLLSGGCLETDLAERAGAVLASGTACVVEYDTRTSDDLIWGLGLGCEGAMRILLQRLAPPEDYQPFAYIQRCRDEQRGGCYALAFESRSPAHPLGHSVWTEAPTSMPAALQHALSSGLQSAAHVGTHTTQVVTLEAATFLVVPIEIAPRLLILGAGPDVAPIVEFAARLGWQVTVLDHRPAYAVPARFPLAQRVTLNPADELTGAADLRRFDAVIVMSHHLLSDLAYLRQLAAAPPRYIGLLGPAARRARLLADLGVQAQQLAGHLYGPAGLDIGATTPETIALAIVSQIQAVLAGRGGGSFAR
jgi:xanthine/CO dehydrogenase XdhC/CoxF family maturation factor